WLVFDVDLGPGRDGTAALFAWEESGPQAAMGRVRAHLFVVEASPLDHGAGLDKAAKHLLVQALVAEPAAETLHEGVLGHCRSSLVGRAARDQGIARRAETRQATPGRRGREHKHLGQSRSAILARSAARVMCS